MADDAWDAEDFEPAPAVKLATGPSDKWEGEDEEDEVKDAWDKDSDEEDKSTDSPTTKAVQRKKKGKLADRIAKNQKAEEDPKLDTPEAKLAEKLRLQKLEETSNLLLARDMLGLKTGSIDSLVPVTKEDFEDFKKAIAGKVQLFTTSEHYPEFIENLVKELCLDASASTLKKVKMHVEGLHSAKLKEEKAAKSKAKPKGKSVKMDLDKDLFSGGGGVEYDDMDDFM